MFKKYDRDRDNLLNRKEVAAYAKGEFSFDLPPEMIDLIFSQVVDTEMGDKGVPFEKLQLLKTTVGISRSRAQDAVNRKKKEERQRVLEAMKEKLLEDVKEGEAALAKILEKITTSESKVTPLAAQANSITATEMLKLVDEIEGITKEGEEALVDVRKEAAEIGSDVDSDLKDFRDREVAKLETKGGQYEHRFKRLEGRLVSFRDQAAKKDAKEVDRIRLAALATMRYHTTVKGITYEDLFSAIDTKGRGVILEDEFIKFFQTCEKRPTEAPADEVEKGKDAEDGDSEVREAKAEAAARAKAEAEQAAEDAKVLDEESVRRLFQSFDEEKEGEIPKSEFMRIVRVYYKVVKETVLTENPSVKDGTVMRRLEVDEVVEILSGPKKDESVEVMRVYVKTMKDELSGWVTLSGNMGTRFLEEGGNKFKVVKETILTDAFELTDSKTTTRKLVDTTRKLKPGEILEVREWPRKEEKSGLMRMKGKCLKDGATGWATTMGNQGNVYLVAHA